ncbi:TIGR04219 family outer membrane beta-barrel protein [Alcanivorax sp. S6407]|uniref:TIGR04219 family outer membrane beta-barrel protein n=1 Tax=Alcanivorax sp. S6407 TaxID=2926424 RepID=UPI001FF6AC0F|nr:TIGR04219 family outer membrane beta-barrel protein [Alcanivorax sp. S6407]MCK0154097.1 TIGR04219 family outer membrane beta-barrel protein [Alcanivorax sp. S6407]
MKRTLIATSALLASTALHAAPGLNIYGGGYNWNTDFKGTVSSGPANVDVEEDLGMGQADQSVIWLGIEHPVPLIPNVRARYFDLYESASNRLQRTFIFNDKPYVASTRVDSELELEMLEGTLYYTPIDTSLKLDVGLTIRQIDGYVRLTSIIADSRLNIDEMLPMAHGAVRFDIPSTGAYLGGELNGIKYNGSSMNDYNVRVGWRSDFLLGVEVGYSQINLNLDNVSRLTTDLDMGGPYVALSLGF